MNCPCEECPNRFVCYTSRDSVLPTDIFHMIHEMVGASSMCWDYPERAGEFDAKKASKIALDFCDYIRERVRKWN